MESKTILFTGATGLIGSGLTEIFSKHSLNIKALSRKKQLPVKNVEWLVSDISESDLTLCKQLEGIDEIIHNAACLKAGETAEELEEIDRVNIAFTRTLLDCAAKVNIKKIIFTSGLNIIKKPLPIIITEISDLNPLTAYAKSKYIGEQMVQEYAAKYGINYNILRLSSLVNFNFDCMPENVLKIWIKQSIQNQTIKVYGNGSRTQDFVAVSDIANAYLNCIEHINTNGIFNVASGNTASMLQVAQLITDKYKNKYEFTGKDENENDRWNISIEKAATNLNYTPQFTSKEVIQTLLANI